MCGVVGGGCVCLGGGRGFCVCVCDVNALKENACALANTCVVIICTDNLLATFSELSCSKS